MNIESEWVSERVSECVRKCGRGKEIDRKTDSLDTQTEIKRETGVKTTSD